jgi:hypothetical protein
MGSEVLQSPWFWPLIFLIVVIYYGWVLFHYFRGTLKNLLKGKDSVRSGSGKIVSLKWDELVLSFELHRRLIGNPLAQLDPDEKSLLEKSPYRELVLKTTSK